MRGPADEQAEEELVSIKDLGYTPILVELSDGTPVDLRYLSGADGGFLTKLIDQDLDTREFVVSFLHHQLRSPVLSQTEVRALSDDDLKRMARAFAKAQPSGFGKEIPSDADVYGEFLDTARAYQDQLYALIRGTLAAFTTSYVEQIKPIVSISNSLASSLGTAFKLDPLQFHLGLTALNLDSAAKAIADSMTLSTRNLVDGLSSGVVDAIKTINGDFTRPMTSLVRPLDIETLLPKLPDISAPLRRLVKVRDGAAALDEAGFGYTYALWEMEFLISLSDIDSQERSVRVASELRAITEDEEFENELQELFTAPSVLSNRWPAVREGVENHRQGRYFSSVSVLLPQIEGIINDILMHLNLTIRVKTRFYERNPDGTPGRELPGLDSKNSLARNRAHVNEDLAKFVASGLVPERNSILHGVDIAYGNATRSVHLMLVLLSLALTMKNLEEDASEKSVPTP